MADLAELFARDPLQLTDDNIGEIVKELRAKRENFLLGDKAAAKPPKPSSAPKIKLDLAALGLKKKEP